MNVFAIRPALPQDAKLLAALHEGAHMRAWTAEEMQRLLGEPHIAALVIERETQARGFVMASFAADEAEILMLVVLPETRRLGLGRNLMEAIHSTARSRGAKRIILEVSEDNEGARGLYASLAFSEVGRRPRYYDRQPHPPADALILALGLSDDLLNDKESA